MHSMSVTFSLPNYHAKFQSRVSSSNEQKKWYESIFDISCLNKLISNTVTRVFSVAHKAIAWNIVLLPAATKLGQGNVFTGVCDSVHRGVCLPQCMLGYHTPPQSRHPSEQTPPWEQTHTPSDQTHPWEQTHPPPGADIPLGADTPPGSDTPSPRSRHTPWD